MVHFEFDFVVVVIVCSDVSRGRVGIAGIFLAVFLRSRDLLW